MNLTKDNRTGHYRASFRTVDGKRRSITTRTANRQEAQRVVRESGLPELETAAKIRRLTNEAISLIISGRKITVEKTIDLWLQRLRCKGRSENTIAQSKCIMMAFCRDAKVSHLPPISVTYEHVSKWINSPSEIKANSRGVMLSAARSLFEFCSANGWTNGNPAKDVEVNMGLLGHAQKEPRTRSVFTEGEVAALMAATPCSSFWRAAIAIGRWTGLRLCDVASLSWDSFATPGKIIVWTQKRDKRVELPMKPEALVLAFANIKQEDPKYCFPEQRKIVMDPKRRSLLSVQFRRLALSCGIANTSFHSLRSMYVMAQDAAGIPIEHIQRAVGHSSEEQTRAYIRRP